MKPAIEITGLSKHYRISHQQKAQYRSLRDDITALFTKPLSLVTGRTQEVEEFWALKDVSFTVDPGDVVGIIGRNGSGKSTLLKILSRITDPTKGQAIMRGNVASLLEVGTGFHPELTGRENIYFNGSILGMSRKEIDRKFDEIVAFAETEKFLDTPVKFYSSGMYVRLAFAVAAHLEPDILIVDEVLAVGDAAFQKKCLNKMSDVAGEGRTVLFVSHNMPTIQRLCNKGVHLVNGTVATIGSVKEAVDSYLNIHLNAASSYHLAGTPNAKQGTATELEIFDSQGQPASAINFGEPWRVRVNFTANEAMEKFVVGMGLKNNVEVAVWTTWSEPQKIAPGKYAADFTFDGVTLESGIYNLSVGLSDDHRTFFASSSDAFFSIEEPAERAPRIAQSTGSGLILNPADYTITKLGNGK